MMFSSTDTEKIESEIAPKIRVLQIIHVALLLGPVAYLVYLFSQGREFSNDPDTLPLVPIGFAAVCAAMSFVYPSFARRKLLAELRLKSQSSTVSPFGVFSVGYAGSMGFLEGGALFACHALNGDFGDVPQWYLALPIALLALMAMRFPRKSAAVEWVARATEETAT